MLHTLKHSVKFYYRVPVCLAVADHHKHRSVMFPLWVQGMGFSYSQHSKLCQLPVWVAGFYCLPECQKKLKLAFASLVTHVNLMNGHQYLSCLAPVFHRKDLIFRLLRHFFHRKLQGIERGFPRSEVGLLAVEPKDFFSPGSRQQLLRATEREPCECHWFKKHSVYLLVSFSIKPLLTNDC